MGRVNVSLAFGGSAVVYMKDYEVIYLNDTPTSFFCDMLPASLMFPVRSGEDINTLLMRSDGLALSAAYKVVALDAELNNIISINFT